MRAVGAAVSFGTIAIDRAYDYELVPSSAAGGPDAAIAILSTIAVSMVTLTALVLTITMVVVQLAMGQFSPRIVQTILRDKPSQIAIGLFVATFAHAMLAMREVHFGRDATVPGLAIVVAYVLVVVSIVVLVLYVHHIGRSLRVSKLIELVGRDTRRQLDRTFPDHGPPLPSGQPQRICAEQSGVLVHLDHERLVKVAREADCTLVLQVALGDFVPAGGALFVVEGTGTVDADAVRRGLVLALERSLDQDVAYGFRMLVDIAERSLAESPFTDPTTAVQAIDRLHDGLRQIARRPFPSGRHADAGGAIRLIVPTMDWDAYVRLAFDELRRVGARSPQVSRRLASALEDLRAVALPDRVGALDRQRELLAEAVRAAAANDANGDARFLLEADRQGLGPAAGAGRGA